MPQCAMQMYGMNSGHQLVREFMPHDGIFISAALSLRRCERVGQASGSAVNFKGSGNTGSA